MNPHNQRLYPRWIIVLGSGRRGLPPVVYAAKDGSRTDQPAKAAKFTSVADAQSFATYQHIPLGNGWSIRQDDFTEAQILGIEPKPERSRSHVWNSVMSWLTSIRGL